MVRSATRKKRTVISHHGLPRNKRKFQQDKKADPLGKWKELRKEGKIGNLKREETEGGIPIPMPSFGVREYDEGARFDLRLPCEIIRLFGFPGSGEALIDWP